MLTMREKEINPDEDEIQGHCGILVGEDLGVKIIEAKTTKKPNPTVINIDNEQPLKDMTSAKISGHH
jgi:hypothetical protein